MPLEIDGWPGAGTQNCDCVFKRDLLANVKRVWKVLLSVESAETSPLLKLTKQNLWLTASSYTFRRHLRHVAFRMGTQWDARVIADASLMSAWLATAKKVRDPDVTNPSGAAREFDGPPSDEFMTLLDLVAPYDLLIIRLGIKAAANKEMANVLAEALNERDMLGKPTWVIDDPARPLRPPTLGQDSAGNDMWVVNHKCFNEDVMAILEDYERLVLKEESSPLAESEHRNYTNLRHGTPVAPTAPMPAEPVARVPVTPGMTPVAMTTTTVTTYAPKQVAMEAALAASPVPVKRALPVPRAPDPEDDDEFSVASLVAAAINPTPVPDKPQWTHERDTPLRETDEVPDSDFDVENALENFPSADELRSNGRPKFLERMALTIDERKAAQKKAKHDKKGGHGR